MPNKNVHIIHLGKVDYKACWDLQTQLLEDIAAIKLKNRELPLETQIPTPNYILTCEHPHVYTLGRNGDKEHLLADTTFLQKNEIAYFEINRGGDITYHGPGQLVVYPILDLDNFSPDIHKYLRDLEEAVILTLQEYDISAGRIEGLTGVWLGVGTMNPRKICAMGVKASRWITMHGLALNVHTDLQYFQHIIPCGINDKAVTSMHRERIEMPVMRHVADKLMTHIAALFEMNIINVEEKEIADIL